MNVFALSTDTEECARFHCDKHAVKMICEYGQLLSTAHRVIDGEMRGFEMPDGRVKYARVLPGEEPRIVEDAQRDPLLPVRHRLKFDGLPAATHEGHPCAVWARASVDNYSWLFCLFGDLLDEYTHRYGRRHDYSRLLPTLCDAPADRVWRRTAAHGPTPIPLVMPEPYQVNGDPIESYRNFYVAEKSAFARWTGRPVPGWFSDRFDPSEHARFQGPPRVDRPAARGAARDAGGAVHQPGEVPVDGVDARPAPAGAQRDTGGAAAAGGREDRGGKDERGCD